ncbi:alpha/beta fold hydrolase [Wenzhouxiangella sp. C33]|uniref:Alpha/beta fold hydrolase n=2 Tax=Wenzhouxiangella limi TaxID=2707351 RepID=A0A845UYM9_9GAMM|nr:alpha/beta fold hydrolase [Wenzhouxiangella limi]
MGLSARQYIRFGQALAASGIETLIHEWRGLGSSSLRASRTVDWGYRELLEMDLDPVIDRARELAADRPLIIGGHSLGSQLALLVAARRPEDCQGLLIVAGGAPYWRCFSGWMRLTLHAIFFGMPTLAGLIGHYPGRRLGFAGREARGVISDWTASGRSGLYRPAGMDFDFEAALGQLDRPLLSVRMADDWFVPQASLDWLGDKLGSVVKRQADIDRTGMDGPADHYRWMKAPASTAEAVANWARLQIQPA